MAFAQLKDSNDGVLTTQFYVVVLQSVHRLTGMDTICPIESPVKSNMDDAAMKEPSKPLQHHHDQITFLRGYCQQTSRKS